MNKTISRSRAPSIVALLIIALTWASPSRSVSSEDAGAPSLYVALEEPLVVNIFTRKAVHFLRVTTQFKLSDPSQASLVREHLTPIKHNLVMLLSSKKYYELQTTRGKAKLRKQALEAVRKVMQENAGAPLIENIFFTSLILQ